MDLLLVCLRLLLAAVLGAAAFAKLLAPDDVVRSVRGLGLPARLAAPTGVLLPWVEITVAVALVPGATAIPGALAATVLFAAFTVLVAGNLLRHRRPRCNCFGQLHQRPISWWTAARNAALLVGSITVAGGGGGPGALAGTTRWVDRAHPSVVASLLLCGLAVVIGLMFALGRGVSLGRSMEAGAEPLHAGSPLPEFVVLDRHGRPVRERELLSSSGTTLLAFIDPNCGPCASLAPELADWQALNHPNLTVRVLSRGAYDDNRAMVDDHGIDGLYLHDGSVNSSFGVPGTPAAVAIGAGGWLSSDVVAGVPEVRSLANKLRGVIQVSSSDHAHEQVPATPRVVGDPVPYFELPSVDGSVVDAAHLSGSVGVLLYLDPDCGFCRQLLTDLRAWEYEPGGQSLKVLVLSAGSADATKWMGLGSTTALDREREIARAFGLDATPSAVLTDAANRIASVPAVGTEDVMALLRRARQLAAIAEEAHQAR